MQLLPDGIAAGSVAGKTGAVPAPRALTPAARRKRILIVDDEPAMLRIMQLGLARTAYAVTVASSGRQGLEEFQRESFDLVISDRMMPEMCGEELATTLKSQSPATPIVLMSGLDAVAGTPCDAYLKKPFTMKELMVTVNGLLPRGAG